MAACKHPKVCSKKRFTKRVLIIVRVAAAAPAVVCCRCRLCRRRDGPRRRRAACVAAAAECAHSARLAFGPPAHARKIATCPLVVALLAPRRNGGSALPGSGTSIETAMDIVLGMRADNTLNKVVPKSRHIQMLTAPIPRRLLTRFFGCGAAARLFLIDRF